MLVEAFHMRSFLNAFHQQSIGVSFQEEAL
jgi:hypothetical protein